MEKARIMEVEKLIRGGYVYDLCVFVASSELRLKLNFFSFLDCPIFALSVA